MKKLTIEFSTDEHGRKELDVVAEDGRRCEGLTIGEVFEQILFMHFHGVEKYPMSHTTQLIDLTTNRPHHPPY